MGQHGVGEVKPDICPPCWIKKNQNLKEENVPNNKTMLKRVFSYPK
jgi:hypothetical protein